MQRERDRLRAIIATQNAIATAGLRFEDVLDSVAQRAQELTGATGALVELVEPKRMRVAAASGTAARLFGSRLPRAGTPSGLCAGSAAPLHADDTRADARFDADACRRLGARAVACAPLLAGGGAVGALTAVSTRPGGLDADAAVTLELLAEVVVAHLSRPAAADAAAGGRDVLTGLWNRPAFEERLAQELARQRRYGGGFAIALFDLDRLGAVNAEHGLEAGDAVLRAMARCLGDVRGSDVAYRVGGDEFALLLPETAAPGAEVVARRVDWMLRRAEESRGVRASWGVAEAFRAPDAGALVAQAQGAVSARKRLRRARFAVPLEEPA